MSMDVRHFLELLWGMTEKELHVRYKFTMLGFLWMLINPILQMLVIGFIFTFFTKETVENYYYYLFIGLLIWNFFSISLNAVTPSIVYDRALIGKAAFPHVIIPLSIILSNLIHFAAAFILLLIPVLFLNTMSAGSIVYIIAGLLLLCIFTTGLSLLTCALNVRYRDVKFIVEALLIVWFYASPVIYSLTQIPYRFLWLWRFNPLTAILQLFQYGLLGAAPPGPAMLASNIFVIFITVLLGILVFKKNSPTFDDWV